MFGDFMHAIGIVVEYNPLHNGHLYQIEKIKEMYPNSLIIVAMSGNFTQRGEISVLSKWDKAFLALEYGVDIVLEIPFVFCNQSADTFSYAAVKMLNEFKIDALVFGSESENLDKLMKVAQVQINNESFDLLVKSYIDKGYNYPTSLSKAIFDLTKEKIIESNDLLAVSYIKEIIKYNYNILPLPIKRTNSYLDVLSDEDIVSASNIRRRIQNNENISKYIPRKVIDYVKKIDYEKLFLLLKYKIISDKEMLNIFNLVDEGIENRIYEAAIKSNNIKELIDNIKTKRYTYNKINRILINLLVGFTKKDASKFKKLEYIRVLGMSENGRNYFKNIKSEVKIPVITKFIKNDMLSLELKATMLYVLIMNDKNVVINEVKKHTIIL